MGFLGKFKSNSLGMIDGVYFPNLPVRMLVSTRLLNKNKWEVNHHPNNESHMLNRDSGVTLPIFGSSKPNLPTVKIEIGLGLDANAFKMQVTNVILVRMTAKSEIEVVDSHYVEGDNHDVDVKSYL